jgi:hypothetical protein
MEETKCKCGREDLIKALYTLNQIGFEGIGVICMKCHEIAHKKAETQNTGVSRSKVRFTTKANKGR